LEDVNNFANISDYKNWMKSIIIKRI
jgi:hypothetical protein